MNKVVFLGDSGVGKTSIINMKINNTFDVTEPITIGSASSVITVDVWSTSVSMTIWDTAGQERYRSMAGNFVRNAKFGVIVGDITQQSSLDSIDNWIDTLHQWDGSIPYLIVINKTDLMSSKQSILNSKREQLMSKYKNVLFVSALLGTNIDAVFDYAAKETLRSQSSEEHKVVDMQDDKPKKKCC